jgi:hypothetical protein
LKELFEFTNGYSSFLTEAAFDLSQPDIKASTSPLVSFDEQVGGGTAIGQDDRDLNYTKALFLSSPIIARGMDTLWEEVSLKFFRIVSYRLNTFDYLCLVWHTVISTEVPYRSRGRPGKARQVQRDRTTTRVIHTKSFICQLREKQFCAGTAYFLETKKWVDLYL